MFRKLSVIFTIGCLQFIPIGLSAQETQQKLNWIQSGNCWVAEPGFLYCGSKHPYVEDNPGPFLSFACFKDYQAVLLNHDSINDPSTIRTVELDFGSANYSDVWIAASESDTFMSNNISPGNDGYFNTLRGLGDKNSTHLKFSVSPTDVNGMLELTGDEYLIVGAYVDLCNSQFEQ